MSLDDIFSISPPPLFDGFLSSLDEIPLLPTTDEAVPLRLLDQLLRDMISRCAPEYANVYLGRLQDSLSSLQGRTIKWRVGMDETARKQALREHLLRSQERVRDLYEVMKSSLLPSTIMQATYPNSMV
jgi:hypothetical protein